MKKASTLFLILLTVVLALASCRTATPVADTKPQVVYEAVFVNDAQVASFFREVRGEAPYPNEKTEFHVTTAFMPEQDARDLYGSEITVLITGYIDGEATMDDGRTTRNEGFKVELLSADPDMTVYLEESPIVFHITGSYKDAAKYTGQLDFSAAQPVSFVTTGFFGAYLTDSTVTFSPDPLR